MSQATTHPPQILQAMVAIATELAKVGIAKSRTNEQQHFQFRGIDDTMNVIAPIFARHEVVFVPNYYVDGNETEHLTQRGGTLFKIRVRGEFRLISAKDNSSLTITAPGQAMDAGDKACNKAMSASLKYALLHTFLVPTETNEDADASTPEPTVPTPPPGFAAWFDRLMEASDQGIESFRDVWAAGHETFRDYAVKARKDECVGAKRHANTVTAEFAEAAAADEAYDDTRTEDDTQPEDE